ncbi:MAG: paraquat-inducible protein A [Steroidobacteraceae bacterium]
MNLSESSVACPDCDLLQQIPPLGPGRKAACARCGRTLLRQPRGPRDLPLALTIAAAIALIVAFTLPLMELHVVGRFASTTIPGGAWEMWLAGQYLVSVLVLFCAVIAPAGYVLFMLVLLLAARRTPVPHWAGEMLRWVTHIQVWSMLEVVMLGVLVALTKIAQLASVEPGIGMYAFGATIVLIPAIMTNFDRRQVWQRVEWSGGEIPLPAPLADSVRASK